MMRGAEKRLLGGVGRRGGIEREEGEKKTLGLNFCWRILIFRCASKTPAPAIFAGATPESTYTPEIMMYEIISEAMFAPNKSQQKNASLVTW